jgi:hypothetical protein
MWARCRAVGPRDYEVDSSGIAPEFPTCEAGVFLLDDKPIRQAEAVRLELTSDKCAATCFQDRLLIRPDDFRL